MTREVFRALGSLAVVATDRPEDLPPALEAVRLHLDRVDRACSRFREDSELNWVNAAAGGGPVRVGALLLEAVNQALRAARLTDGLVDPTLGDAVAALGYDRDFAQLAARPAAAAAGSVPAGPGPTPPVSWRDVEVDASTSCLRLPPGTRLDLGATAKAWAADGAAAAAATVCDGGVLVSLGGDIALAGPAPLEGWAVRITDSSWSDPQTADGPVVVLRSGGLASSGTTVRRWAAADGRTHHHLLDPATRLPAQTPWRLVTVAAGCALDANIASTAAVILGDAAPAWLERASSGGGALPARLVTTDGAVRHVGDWPADTADPTATADPTDAADPTEAASRHRGVA